MSMWCQTYTGVRFFPLQPVVEDVNITDIAHALSLSNRFAGHTTVGYSVAQHCEYVSRKCNPENALKGLLHDASEAYLSDIVSPVKYDDRFSFYREAEENLQNTIFERFGLLPGIPEDVKRADWKACQLEAWSFLPGEPIDGWAGPRPRTFLVAKCAEEAEKAFLARFYELYALTRV